MPSLSLCLIARDEEEMLPACLASVAAVVDEVIVVDTGSVDATARIARDAGARLAHVAWAGDFSAPRNAGLRLATGDFVLVLDADERLAPGAGPRLRAAVEGAAFDCGMVRLHNASRIDAAPAEVLSGAARLGPPMPLPRLLRRTPDLRYAGIVHESVSDWLAARGMRVAPVDVDVVHLGAIPAVRERRGKRERNLDLLRRRCELEPDRVTPFGYLALELLSHGDLEGAAAAVERGWAVVDAQPADVSILRLAVARAMVAVEQGAPGRALEAIARAERAEGAQPDLCHLRGRALALAALGAGAERGPLLRQAEAAFRAALALAGAPAQREYVAGASSWASWSGLGEVMLCEGRRAEASAAFGEALARRPGSAEAALGRVEALLPVDPAAALARVEGLLDSRPDGWLLASEAARAIGAADDAEALRAQAAARAARSPWRSARRAARLGPSRAVPGEAR